jgi:hypothetical protein
MDLPWWPPTVWLPRSLDLRPLELFLWGYII